jgi:hypothetical protein
MKVKVPGVCLCEERDASGCLMIGVGREGGIEVGQFDELTYAGGCLDCRG